MSVATEVNSAPKTSHSPATKAPTAPSVLHILYAPLYFTTSLRVAVELYVSPVSKSPL